MGSILLDWYFRIGSTNSHVNEYQISNLPVPKIINYGKTIEWNSLVEDKQWAELAELLLSACRKPGVMPEDVSICIEKLSRKIQEIESDRVLKSRFERSSLAEESQPIQDVIDRVISRCYGLNDDDFKYVEQRIKEML